MLDGRYRTAAVLCLCQSECTQHAATIGIFSHKHLQVHLLEVHLLEVHLLEVHLLEVHLLEGHLLEVHLLEKQSV